MTSEVITRRLAGTRGPGCRWGDGFSGPAPEAATRRNRHSERLRTVLCRPNPTILPLGNGCRPRWRRVKPPAEMVKGVSSDAPRLRRDRSRIRLHRIPVSGGELWRPPLADPARPRQRADLSAVAGDLLHFVDVLRLGRICHPPQRLFSRDLCRPDPDDRALHSAAPPRDPAGKIAEHHLAP